jgi:hypothetical protein
MCVRVRMWQVIKAFVTEDKMFSQRSEDFFLSLSLSIGDFIGVQ